MPPTDTLLWTPILAYATAIDEKDFAALAQVFHPDVVGDYVGTCYSGVVSIVERMTFVHTRIGGSRHRLTNFRVVSRSDDEAFTTTYVDAFLTGGTLAPTQTYRDVGTYLDRLVPYHDRWVIAWREYRRLWREGDVMSLSPETA